MSFIFSSFFLNWENPFLVGGDWETRGCDDTGHCKKNLEAERDFRTTLFLYSSLFHLDWTKAFHHYTYVDLLTFPRVSLPLPDSLLNDPD